MKMKAKVISDKEVVFTYCSSHRVRCARMLMIILCILISVDMPNLATSCKMLY